jgi:hypothetical protein
MNDSFTSIKDILQQEIDMQDSRPVKFDLNID